MLGMEKTYSTVCYAKEAEEHVFVASRGYLGHHCLSILREPLVCDVSAFAVQE